MRRHPTVAALSMSVDVIGFTPEGSASRKVVAHVRLEHESTTTTTIEQESLDPIDVASRVDDDCAAVGEMCLVSDLFGRVDLHVDHVDLLWSLSAYTNVGTIFLNRRGHV